MPEKLFSPSRILPAVLFSLVLVCASAPASYAGHLTWEEILGWFGYEDEEGRRYVCQPAPDQPTDGEHVYMNDICIYVDHVESPPGSEGDDGDEWEEIYAAAVYGGDGGGDHEWPGNRNGNGHGYGLYNGQGYGNDHDCDVNVPMPPKGGDGSDYRVPEPTLLLVLAGGCVLVFLRSRRRKR